MSGFSTVSFHTSLDQEAELVHHVPVHSAYADDIEYLKIDAIDSIKNSHNLPPTCQFDLYDEVSKSHITLDQLHDIRLLNNRHFILVLLNDSKMANE